VMLHPRSTSVSPSATSPLQLSTPSCSWSVTGAYWLLRLTTIALSCPTHHRHSVVASMAHVELIP
jgi:hypothetical protein